MLIPKLISYIIKVYFCLQVSPLLLGAGNLRSGWNALKDCQAVTSVTIDSLAKKLLSRESMNIWIERKDNWQGIIHELCYLLKEKAKRELTRPRVVHALFVAAGNVEFINQILFAGELGYSTLVMLCRDVLLVNFQIK